MKGVAMFCVVSLREVFDLANFFQHLGQQSLNSGGL